MKLRLWQVLHGLKHQHWSIPISIEHMLCWLQPTGAQHNRCLNIQSSRIGWFFCLQSLQWVYGLSNLPSNIVNLSDEHNDRVVYAAAHTAVIYDKRTKKQTALQVVDAVIGCRHGTMQAPSQWQY